MSGQQMTMNRPRPAWLSEVQNTKDPTSTTTYIRVLLYGEMGSGKTTVAATFPKPLFLNTDKGLRTIAGKDIPYIDFNPGRPVYHKIIQILQDLQKGNLEGLEVQTVVIDGFTSLAELMLREIVLENRVSVGDPTKEKALFDDYGMLRQRMWSIATLLQSIPCHVVGTCWATIEKDEVSGQFIGRPEMVGKFRETLGGYFDEYYFLECRAGRQGEPAYVYEAHTKPYRWWQARTRINLPAVIRDLTYEKIVEGMKR